MAESKENNNKGGAGKFFLGAALGAAAGFIASKFISANMKKDGGEEIEESCDCGAKCGKDDKCDKTKAK